MLVPIVRLVAAVIAAALIAVGCGGDDDPTTITLVTHDSFAVSDGIFDRFEADTGLTVEVFTTADAGTMVSEAVLTAGDPVGDVLFGIDNTFLQRGLDADVFLPYVSAGLAQVPDEFELDDEHRVTPIDVGDVCVNYWVDEVDPPPADLAALARPEYASTFVTQNPETSSPGFAFLLATIATFGEEGWEDYWAQLRDNGLEVTPGWTEAYFESFVAGGGDRAIVTSYASSPVAEVVLADPRPDEAPSAVLGDSCFRQIEFAGVLRGTDAPDAAGQLIDFLLSDTFQEDIPLNMFVFPVSETAALPPEFTEFTTLSDDPLMLDPAVIEASRADWTERWTEVVLG